MLGVAAGDRVILELAEAFSKGDMLGTGDVLVAQEQHPVLEQERLDLGKQCIVARGVAEIHVEKLGADAGGQLFVFDRCVEHARAHDGGRVFLRFSFLRHDVSSW